jgi:hypothetical protein
VQGFAARLNLSQMTFKLQVEIHLNTHYFSVQWPLISLTRSYDSQAFFAVNHNASLFPLSEDEAHSQKIKTGEEEQPQTS